MSVVTAEGEVEGPPVEGPVVRQIEEWGRVEIPADAILRDGRLDVFPAVLDHGYFTLRSHAAGVTLQAGGYIGVIPLNDRLTIDVTARVPVANFARLMEISQHLPAELSHAVRHYGTEAGLLPSLVDLYARTLVGYVDDITFRGLHKEYARREAETSFPKGRIALGQTATRLASHGITHRVAVEWFERTADNGANRALKYALWFLAQVHHAAQVNSQPGGQQVTRALNRAYRRLDAVTLDRGREFLRDDIVAGRTPLPPLRSYYQDAMDLARTIIREQAISWDRPGEALRLPSLVLDMSSIFESYLFRLLKLVATANQWPVTVLDGNKMQPVGGGKRLFDADSLTEATPDIVVAKGTMGRRTYPVIVEVKYKPAPNRDDLNQAIAYAASYRCHEVIVVQPKATNPRLETGLKLLGRIDDLSVYRYVFDLGAPDLSDQEDRFARTVLVASGGASST